jgi:hypothetical protein
MTKTALVTGVTIALASASPLGAQTTTTPCANPPGGYEGFGRNTTGGAGQPVYRVTNLDDGGAGSLRDAVSQGNRCIVFDVGGTIYLSRELFVRGGNSTIDGFTAPSPGITLRGATLSMRGDRSANNVVLRGIRHRASPDGTDGFSVYGASNIVIDRVSVSGFGDGGIDVTQNSRDVTIQWSIIGKGGRQGHNFPNLIAYESFRVTVHHNLYIDSDYRNPLCSRLGAKSTSLEVVCDVRNNLVWDYAGHGQSAMDYGTANVVNNYYYSSGRQAGDGNTANERNTVYVGTGASSYVSGNYSQNGWNVNATGNRSTPYPAVVPATTDALNAAHDVIAKAGARGSKFGLDSEDQTYIRQVSLPSGQ